MKIHIDRKEEAKFSDAAKQEGREMFQLSELLSIVLERLLKSKGTLNLGNQAVKLVT
jgi:hypothetical protein